MMTISTSFLLILVLLSRIAASADSFGLNWSKLIYDDSYLVKHLDERFPYLKLDNGSYLGPRDYFNFSHVFEPSKEYLKRVNLEEHLYDELRAMEISSSIATMDQWHYSDKDELIKSGLPEADERRCFDELDKIKTLLDAAGKNSSLLFERNSLNNIQWLRYIDSWARPPSETYHGHSYWVGSYRGCLMAELERLTDSTGTTKFRYCWAKLRARDWPEEDEMVPTTSIRAGVCLPRSCDTLAANKRLDVIHKIMLFNFAPLHRDRFNKLIGVYCLPNRSGIGPAGKLFYRIVLTWIALVVALSAFAVESRVRLGLGNLPDALRSLTVQENFRRLVADDISADKNSISRVDLRPLGLVRLFASITVCIAHCACAFGWVFYSSTFNMINYRSLRYQVIPSLFKAVDLYLVIGGLLSSYVIMKRFSGQKRRLLVQPATYLRIVVARYLRLAPIFIFVLAFMKAIYPHVSEGPMWDYGTYKYSMQSQCRHSSWWRILGLPIVFDLSGNPYLSECLSVSWYVIADLKISFVVPLIVYLMTKSSRPSDKWWLTFALVSLSTLNQYKDLSMQKLIFFKQFFHYGQLFGANILSLTFGESGYFSATNRLHAVAVGLLAGVQLYLYETGTSGTVHEASRHIKAKHKGERKWPFWMRGPFFWTAILWEVYDFFVPILVQRDYLMNGQTPSEETIKLAMVLKPRFDALIFSIILLRLVSDLAPKLMQNTLLLYKLSKLSYCVFLVHTIIIAYVVSADEKSRPDSMDLQLIVQTTFVICISFLISFPLYLLIESPIAQLLSHFLKTLSAPSSVNLSVVTRGDSKRPLTKNQNVREMTRV